MLKVGVRIHIHLVAGVRSKSGFMFYPSLMTTRSETPNKPMEDLRTHAVVMPAETQGDAAPEIASLTDMVVS